jgi:hypothetical protein
VGRDEGGGGKGRWGGWLGSGEREVGGGAWGGGERRGMMEGRNGR